MSIFFPSNKNLYYFTQSSMHWFLKVSQNCFHRNVRKYHSDVLQDNLLSPVRHFET
ncbi:unnamed protein product [Larinioides sclopetarius]|uniref:Uncharacterized protein n=1 Tax=Larinioides sclopetarius TaxID=280406 RepID=A0AAV2AAD3_9ARAC